jgi:hypothetical protein
MNSFAYTQKLAPEWPRVKPLLLFLHRVPSQASFDSGIIGKQGEVEFERCFQPGGVSDKNRHRIHEDNVPNSTWVGLTPILQSLCDGITQWPFVCVGWRLGEYN